MNYPFKAIESQQTTFNPHCTTTETPNAQPSHPAGFDRYRQLGGPRDVKLIFTLHPHSFCLFTCFLSITSSFHPLIPQLTPFSLHSCVVLQNVCNLVLEFHCTSEIYNGGSKICIITNHGSLSFFFQFWAFLFTPFSHLMNHLEVQRPFFFPSLQLMFIL